MSYRVLPLVLAALVLAVFVSSAVAADEQKKKNDSHEGIVVMAMANTLTMTDMQGKNEHTHDVARDAKITLNGKECRLEDLKKGYHVRVTTQKRGEKDVAMKIEAKPAK